MQILKSNTEKSVTIQHILNDTNSYCFVYYEQPLPFESYFVDSNTISLDQLKNTLEAFMDINNDDILDYFILYTNNTEEELKDLISWLDYNSYRLNARTLLVTCK